MAQVSGDTHRCSSARSSLQKDLCHSLSVESPRIRTCALPSFAIFFQSRSGNAGQVPSHWDPPRCASSKTSSVTPDDSICCAVTAAIAPKHRKAATATNLRMVADSLAPVAEVVTFSSESKGVASVLRSAMVVARRSLRSGSCAISTVARCE